MKPTKPPSKLPPEWIKFYAATGAVGGKSRSKKKRLSSAANARSPEARAKMSTAQKARWAAWKAEKAKLAGE